MNLSRSILGFFIIFIDPQYRRTKEFQIDNNDTPYLFEIRFGNTILIAVGKYDYERTVLTPTETNLVSILTFDGNDIELKSGFHIGTNRFGDTFCVDLGIEYIDLDSKEISERGGGHDGIKVHPFVKTKILNF